MDPQPNTMGDLAVDTARFVMVAEIAILVLFWGLTLWGIWRMTMTSRRYA